MWFNDVELMYYMYNDKWASCWFFCDLLDGYSEIDYKGNIDVGTCVCRYMLFCPFVTHAGLGQEIVVLLEKSVSHCMFVGRWLMSRWLMFLCISSPCR